MNTKSSLPRKQRKARANAPIHRKSKEIRVMLDPAKFSDPGSWSVTLHKGDSVRIVRGSRAGHEGKVAIIDVKNRRVSVEKALINKADNKEVSLWFDPSNLVVTKLDLSDPYRKDKLKNIKEG